MLLYKYLTLSFQPVKNCESNVPILCESNLRLREVEQFTQGHTAEDGQRGEQSFYFPYHSISMQISW